MGKIRVLVWNENVHERTDPEVGKVYPEGIHGTIAKFLREYDDLEVVTATLEQPECGLTADVLANTDVLIWWGHMKHDAVPDEIVARVHMRVLCGMGLICLHSAHMSKIFQKLTGTHCGLRWHEIGERERIFIIEPRHPITQGLPSYFEVEHEEMYGERFDIPTPDELLMIGWFQSGEVFRSGCVFYRGMGKVFYFQPGHETYATYHNPDVQKVIANAAHWAKADYVIDKPFIGHVGSLEQF